MTPHILLVDDNPADRELVPEAFAEAGIDARFSLAKDGVEAMEALAVIGPVDLMILDLNMPRMSGLEVLARIRQHPELARMLVFVLTSSAAASDRYCCRAADAYFVKCCDWDGYVALAHAMSTHLEADLLAASVARSLPRLP